MIVIDKEDRWAPELNDVSDVERLLPGVIDSIREWFRSYKIPDGKPPNKFALDEQCMGRNYAMKVVAECHMSWRILVGKAEAGEEVPRNLSVSRLSELAGDIEPEHILALEAQDTVDAGEQNDEEGEEQYPTSLIA